ncbi:hypothetical protein [Azospirillum agricola]|uniref:hypothetical protein n=1 Tax=Azospirillum agricola TaxID=1720247 RepID=UPI000A0F3BA5|nr:hypothetical protein [Azospirillum agricola]SMH62844.1 hypothetical protein SAMN02982994_6667 [Azospirillum lipoferum]
MARSDIEALIADLVQEDARLRAGAVDRAIDEAVRRYAKDRPRVLVADTVSTGDYLLAVPAGWEDGSRILSLEWPVGANPPAIRRPGALTLYASPDGPRLQCKVLPPADGVTVRITFSVGHRLTGSDDTIPEGDRTAVASLAASTLLEQLAVATAGDTDSTIPADTVDHKTASDRYAARARAARKVYDDHLGGAAGVVRPVGAAEVGLPGRLGLLRGRRE